MAYTSPTGLVIPTTGEEPNVPSDFRRLVDGLDTRIAPTFATEAARNTAIPAPVVGQEVKIGTTTPRRSIYTSSGWRWADSAVTIAGAANTTPGSLGIATGQLVWDPSTGTLLVAMSASVWDAVGADHTHIGPPIVGSAPPNHLIRTVTRRYQGGTTAAANVYVATGFVTGLLTARAESLDLAYDVGIIQPTFGSTVAQVEFRVFRRSAPNSGLGSATVDLMCTFVGA